ncbi:hypothetical protein BV898_12220 [Hypsibius exemplaris]|uniref:Uncharacterized protein n=1 Tax=Hypsibius exemplaris TaxID=2072580 RepID=A0A1W0WEM9_HYPEX|nr:hypothetical protein BV898_12220 [Hypsibius exemplaris]
MLESVLRVAVFFIVCVITSVTAQLVTYNQFVNAVTSSSGYGAPSREQYNNLLNRAGNGQITTKRELAMLGSWRTSFTSQLDPHRKRRNGTNHLAVDITNKAASEALYRDLRLLDNPDQVKPTMPSPGTPPTGSGLSTSTAHPVSERKLRYDHNADQRARECGNGRPTDSARKRIQIYEAV